MTGHDSKAIQERGEWLNQQRKRKKNDVLKYEEAKRHLILFKYSWHIDWQGSYPMIDFSTP